MGCALTWQSPFAKILEPAISESNLERTRIQISPQIVSVSLMPSSSPILAFALWWIMLLTFCTLPLKELCDDSQGASSRFDGKCRGLGFFARVLLLISWVSWKLYLTWLALCCLPPRSLRSLPATKYYDSVLSWVTEQGHLIYVRWW